ncbi:cytochrome c [uncultured Mucilaginibacter sp.]|uniref:c-type cytochrome n=1 Tax=uncultured Mucilaginibacter sp. TaxID=797541 RepID=UPI0025D5E9B8|nr:cytochrome c [uncultured Mucilaginibacter sp.]
MKLQTPKIKLSALLIAIIAVFTSSFARAQSKPWIAPAAAQAMKNPVASTPDVLKAAKTLYVTNCAPCHGEKGKGDGPAAASLTPHPADHTSAALRNEPDGSLFWKLSEGRTPMPQYKKILTETQRWQLIDYIRSLSKK